MRQLHPQPASPSASRRPRWLGALLTAAGVLLLASEAQAHGGQWKPPEPAPARPGGRPPPTPPPLRKPQPITPAPPPTTPRTPVPPGVTPGTPAPTPVTPPPVSPAPTPVTPGAGPPAGGGTGSGADVAGRARGGPVSSATPETDWQTWWLLNRWAFLPERRLDPERAEAVVTPSGKSADGAAEARAHLQARRDFVAERVALPFLLQRLDPAQREDDEVISASLLALARLTRDPATAALLLSYARDEARTGLVRESAALALGLLRRSDPSRQQDGVLLDLVRRDLLALSDDESAPPRTRAFALLSIGLLGDQPFGSAFTQDGRLITHELGRRLGESRADLDLTVAALTALGMQPAEGVSETLQSNLRRIVLGQRIHRRSWDAHERSHALSALARLHAPGWLATVMHALAHRRSPTPLVRAALLALGGEAGALDAGERGECVNAIGAALDKAHDPATRGLTYLAMARVVRQDLLEGSTRQLQVLKDGKELTNFARNASTACRGFALVALGLALGPARRMEDATARAFVEAGHKELLFQLERSGNPDLRAACVVALGLGAERESADSALLAALHARLADAHEDDALRAHAALALALAADKPADVTASLARAVGDGSRPQVQAEAALALSFLGGRPETRTLLASIGDARSQHALAKVVTALGRLGDPLAAEALVAVARDRARGDEPRALAVAGLGLLLDPEPRPSLMRLSVDANYPARTDALQEAFTIY